jgi:hypothetical protein
MAYSYNYFKTLNCYKKLNTAEGFNDHYDQDAIKPHFRFPVATE